MEEVINLINTVGFPIFTCLAFGWYINQRDMQKNQMEKEFKLNEIEERKKVMETIETYRITSQELLATNKEVCETNRLLANEINNRMNIVENVLIEINHKLS